jgi:hypothetical protein
MKSKAKRKTKAKAKPAAAATPTAAAAPKDGPKVQMVAEYKGTHSGARGAWVDRCKAFDGKPLAAFKASCEAEHPSTPNKGKLKGKLEPFSGWWSWLTRTGIAKAV